MDGFKPTTPYIIMAKKQINGLSKRHVAQIIRRKMITRTKPSGKIYSRKKRGSRD